MERDKQYVGIDLHRNRSVIVRRNARGETLEVTRIANSDLAALERAVLAAGEQPDVILEATLGWYWMADYLKEIGAVVHLAHPLGNNWGTRRVKNDVKDATDLVDLFLLGRLVESYFAPPELRELRELVRRRHKLGRTRTSLKNGIHGVLAKEGVFVGVSDLFGLKGKVLLDKADLGPVYRAHVTSARKLLAEVEAQMRELDQAIARSLEGDPAYEALKTIPGVGSVLAAVFMAEIGDVSRFSSPEKLCSFAGLTPKHRESDDKVRRGHITKQGSRLLRWACVEAVTRQRKENPLSSFKADVSLRRGPQIGRVAAARKLLTLVFYAMRDKQVRCLMAGETA